MFIRFARQWFFVCCKFRIEPFICWYFCARDTFIYLQKIHIQKTKNLLDCNFYSKYNLKCIFCRMQMNDETMMMVSSLAMVGPIHNQTKNQLYLSLLSASAHKHCIQQKQKFCRLNDERERVFTRGNHTHSLHIKYASSSAVYLTSSAIKMLILHCIRAAGLRMHFSIFLVVSFFFKYYICMYCIVYGCISCCILLVFVRFHLSALI